MTREGTEAGKKYGAVIAVTGSSGKAAKIRSMSEEFVGIEERIIYNFRAAGIRDIVVVAGPGKKLVRRLRDQGVVFLREKNPGAEMFDYVRKGLSYLKDSCGSIFFCPESVPFFTGRTVRMMMEQDAEIVISCADGKKGHPVMISGNLVDRILSYQGNGGLKGALDALPVKPLCLETGDSGTISDASTREEFEKLVRHHDHVILRPEIRISLSGKRTFFDRESVALLKQIDLCGNVREACEKNGISYSKAWGVIRSAEEGLGGKIVDRRAGGKDGGGASITERGQKLCELYEQYEESLRSYAESQYKSIFLKSGIFPDPEEDG